MINNFTKQKLKEIKIWSWAAMVLPITSLAAIFFVWAIGLDTLLQKITILGATVIFSIAVVWWWWALWTIAKVVDLLNSAMTGVSEIKDEITLIKKDIAPD